MHVGTCIPFMNHAGVDDHELVKGELALGDLAEPLGFDSLWCFEHHFTSYMLSPNPLQILTYFAGRTKRIRLGTMVVVLPWHHPVRVAEEILLLDHFSHGRTLLGVGRGIGRLEYEGLGVDQNESKALSIELIRCLTADARERHLRVRRRARPPAEGAAPAAPVRLVPRARLHRRRLAGDGADVRRARRRHAGDPAEGGRSARRRRHGLPRRPTSASAARPRRRSCRACTSSTRTRARAKEEGRRQFELHYDAIIDHYEFRGSHFASDKNNKAYAGLQKLLSTPEGEKTWKDTMFPLNPVGTPKQVRDQILDQREMFGANGFVGGARYGAMSTAEGERNLRLFAEKVMPALKAE